jgi:hypothetical protein
MLCQLPVFVIQCDTAMVVNSELIELGKKLALLESTIRLKEPQRIRNILKYIIKIKLKIKNTLKRYSALKNMTHRHVQFDMRILVKVQNVKNNVRLRRVRVKIVAVEKHYVLNVLSVYMQLYTYACFVYIYIYPYYIVICGLPGCIIFFYII